MKFQIELEEHTPENELKPCAECVLGGHLFVCLDRSYCEFHKNGKTWKIKKQIRNAK